VTSHSRLRGPNFCHYRSSHPAQTRHITQLDCEWDFDRTIGTEASVMGLLGLALGIAVDKRFLVLPAVVFGFF
jgi:hypothetical protein